MFLLFVLFYSQRVASHSSETLQELLHDPLIAWITLPQAQCLCSLTRVPVSLILRQSEGVTHFHREDGVTASDPGLSENQARVSVCS